MTAQTKNILSAENLTKTKNGVRIINCARGGLLDERALRAALDWAMSSGAAIDVFIEEPAKTNPLSAIPMSYARLISARRHGSAGECGPAVAEQMSEYLLRGPSPTPSTSPRSPPRRPLSSDPMSRLPRSSAPCRPTLRKAASRRCTSPFRGGRGHEDQGVDERGRRRARCARCSPTSTWSRHRASPRSAASSSRRRCAK